MFKSILSLLKQLWGFMRVNKKWWLLPMLFILMFFGILLVIAQTSAIAPFIYTIF